ncbi:MAG: serine acetyltransferase [Planctomycetota bacterium]
MPTKHAERAVGDPPPLDRALDPKVIDAITESVCREPHLCRVGETRLPDRAAVAELVELIRRLVFPGFFSDRELRQEDVPSHVAHLAARLAAHLQTEITAVLRYAHELGLDLVEGADPAADAELARDLARRFLEGLPEIRRLLSLDVQAAYDGDPAATHTDETILAYPGVAAIFSHRVAHALYALDVPLLPRIIQEMAHTATGIDIHPGCTIGESFFIDHGGAVVIGETAKLGHHVRIYQGVTLGAKSFDADERGRLLRTGKQRHPTIGNRVTIYAGAIILGGETVIGDDCVISGSVFVTESVPAGHVIRNPKPELVMRSSTKGSGGGAPQDGRRYTEAGG